MHALAFQVTLYTFRIRFQSLQSLLMLRKAMPQMSKF